MNVALILSGGCGSRLGSEIPKQYIRVGKQCVVTYVIKTLADHDNIDAIQIVADDKWTDTILREIDSIGAGKEKFRGFSVPGKTRQLSILNGLKSIRKYASDDAWIMVHDAARPMLSSQLIASCFKAATGHDGVLPVLPMKDTVYYCEEGSHVDKLLDRTKIYAGQAPEVFRMDKYWKANVDLLPDEILKINGSTEPAILAGMDIAVIAGDENNFKITTQQDLERFRELIR